ncbi:serine/threonine-protein kinase [Nocardia sp. NPDC003963]
MRTLIPGTIIAGYRIERRLGTGNMGEVYLARHPRLPRTDALKVLARHRAGDAEFRARFLREAELAGRLEHPNVVSVYDCGVDQETPWLAMQFIDGIDAAELLRRAAGGVPPAVAVDIVEGAARGLDEAHRMGLLHRDVKPANLMLSAREFGPDQVRVTDFGIARAVDDTAGLTAAGSVLATIAYAAPEQISGAVPDHRADVYSLGCTLYQLLTGALPFPRATTAAVVHAHLTAPPPRPSKAGTAVPAALDSVLARALAKDPADRYPSCGQLAAAARAALHGRREPALRVARPRRLRVVAATVVALLVAGTAAAVGYLRLGDDSAGQDSPAPPVPPPWGNFQFIVDAFPDLLPATPSATGAHDLRCSTSDNTGRTVPADSVLDEPRLTCSEPHASAVGGHFVVIAVCSATRSPLPPLVPETEGTEGTETWSRPSGTGLVAWKNYTDRDGAPGGLLHVRFDGPAREFCRIQVNGGISGRELREQWWSDAPI